MIRKILHITLIALAPILVVVLLGFAATTNKKLPCIELSVSVNGNGNSHFVDAENLRQEIISRFTAVEGHPIRGSMLREIKEMVNNNPHVKSSRVFRSINGNVTVEVTQREPLVRVFTAHNKGYYIDVDGKLMPLSNNYTARVMVAGGHIFAGYSNEIDLKEVINSNEASTNEKILTDIFKLASFINENPFWRAFIDYIHVKPYRKFELTPKNGAHIVEFGTLDEMEYKFRKLETFYLNGLTFTGWDKYRRLNVKFKNQVVCSQ